MNIKCYCILENIKDSSYKQNKVYYFTDNEVESKELIEWKRKYIDDIKNKNGYPPVTFEEVYNRVLTQVENFKKYN